MIKGETKSGKNRQRQIQGGNYKVEQKQVGLNVFCVSKLLIDCTLQVDPTDETTEAVLSTSKDADHGFILEVDLDYPTSLHREHNDYPLAPEKLAVSKEQMSPYQQRLINELSITSFETEKLVPNLQPKIRYVLHYRNLQLYLSLGMKLTKVHKILEFRQSPWMAPYIEKNTHLRTTATNDFEKDFYKLMNNAVSHSWISLFSLFQISAEFVKCPARVLLDWVSFSVPPFSGVRKNHGERQETRERKTIAVG